MDLRASVSPRQAAVSTSAHWQRGVTCYLSSSRRGRAAGLVQRERESTIEALCTPSTKQLAAAARRTSQDARPNLRCGSIPLAVMDVAPEWTLDQIAGLAFGGILVASVLLAYKVDEAVARSQRRELGLCQECGGLYEAQTCNEKRCPSRKEVVDIDHTITE